MSVSSISICSIPRTIERLYNPCPDGWRVSTEAELTSLKATSVWVEGKKIDGSEGGSYSGRFFGSSSNQIFLPAAGYRNFNTGDACYRADVGDYWSSSVVGTFAFNCHVEDLFIVEDGE